MAMRVTNAMMRAQPPKKNTNAWLSFRPFGQDTSFTHYLWVNTITQPWSVNGSKSQSRTRTHWYPTSINTGEIQVSAVCRGQEDYQHLANFVRRHHEEMISQPGMRFSRNAKTLGYRTLMGLTIPSEDVHVRGWVSSFTRLNQGVKVHAPQVQFSVFVALDPFEIDPRISNQVREFYSGANMKPLTRDQVFGGTDPITKAEKDAIAGATKTVIGAADDIIDSVKGIFKGRN